MFAQNVFLCNKSIWEQLQRPCNWTRARHETIQSDRNPKATSKIFTWPVLFALSLSSRCTSSSLSLFLCYFCLCYWPSLELVVETEASVWAWVMSTGQFGLEYTLRDHYRHKKKKKWWEAHRLWWKCRKPSVTWLRMSWNPPLCCHNRTQKSETTHCASSLYKYKSN